MDLEFSGEVWFWYIVPVKARVRQAEGLEVGDLVTVRLAVDV